MKTTIFAVFLSLIFISEMSLGQILIEDPQAPRKRAQVGEKAARGYFESREQPSRKVNRAPAQEGEHYMSLYFGSFISDKQHRWGVQDSSEDVGSVIFGVDYRVGEWTSSMDLLLRSELISFEVDDENPLMLNIMPVVTFPDVKGDFPLYFGAGVGVGVFFRQIPNESDLSLNYAFLAGVRLPQLFDTGGMMFETGYLGDLHILSSGQFRGVYLKVGGVFSF